MAADRRENEPLWRDALGKILALEEHKGFSDTAVSGGIRRFVERWERELREYLGDDPALATRLIDQPYQELSLAQRRQWVAGWQRALAGKVPLAVAEPPLVVPTPGAPVLREPTDRAPTDGPSLFAVEGHLAIRAHSPARSRLPQAVIQSRQP